MFFAADLVFWHYAIADVGAGLATVLGNLQVVIVPFAAWGILGERIERRVLVALPLVCSGVAADLGRAGDRRVRRRPARGVPFGFLTGVPTPASCSCCGTAAPTSAVRPVRCSTPRSSRPCRRRRGLALGEVEPRPELAGARVAGPLALTSQVRRLAADHRLAPATAGGADLGDAHDPAGRLGRLGAILLARSRARPARRRRPASSPASSRSRCAALSRGRPESRRGRRQHRRCRRRAAAARGPRSSPQAAGSRRGRRAGARGRSPACCPGGPGGGPERIRSITSSSGTSISTAAVSSRPWSSAPASASACATVRGKPSNRTGWSSSPSSASRTIPTITSSGTSSPRSMYSDARRPRSVPASRASRSRSPVASCV